METETERRTRIIGKYQDMAAAYERAQERRRSARDAAHYKKKGDQYGRNDSRSSSPRGERPRAAQG